MEFDQFIDQLVTQKGLDKEEPEVVAQIKADLAERIENRINAFILESLDPEQLEAFEKVLDQDSPEETQKFVRTHIPEFDERVALELMTFQSAYLA